MCRMSRVSRNILVTGLPLLPKAEALLTKCGYEVFVTKPAPGQKEIVANLRKVNPVALIVRVGRVNYDCFEAASGLKVIANHGSGYNDIDVAEATKRGIPVFASPGRNAISVAEHVISLLLAIRKQLPKHDQLVRAGQWQPAKPITSELHGTIIGLIGLGAIGERVALLAQTLGMKVVAFDPGREKIWPNNIQRCKTLDALLGQSDTISLHVPLIEATKNLIDQDAIKKMKTGAVLINTARGGVVDEQAMLDALDTGKLFGAGIDTFETEPPRNSERLLRNERVILTPHVAGVTPESSLRMSICCAENVMGYLSAGRITRDLVNPSSISE